MAKRWRLWSALPAAKATIERLDAEMPSIAAEEPEEAPALPVMRFTALHIDVARFATDDFNPFHDPHKWSRIVGNPFGGPIALGFQLLAFIAHTVNRAARSVGGEFRYTNYRINFADAVRVNEEVALTVKSPQSSSDGRHVSRRIALRGARGLAVTGHVRFAHAVESKLTLPPVQPLSLNRIRDRTEVPGTEYFLKRKFMTTANAKNFLVGAGVDPAVYFDELEDRVSFPDVFPVSLISCALLERGMKRDYDFIARPLVYAYLDITTDRVVVERLKSNDTINILVSAARPPLPVATTLRRGLQVHQCLGFSGHGARVFAAEIGLVPLAALIGPTE